jgi:hypothetical protein
LQSLSNQLHDFNVGMGPNVGTVPGGNNFGTRVFWTALVPDSDVRVDPVEGTARMHVHNLAALDYPEDFASGSLGPNWQTAYVPATVSFDVVWSPPVKRLVTVSDATDQFAGTFAENRATVVWSAKSASGFRFQSLPGNSLTSTPGAPNIATTYFFAEVGHERNGSFFPSDDRSGDGGGDNALVRGNHAALVQVLLSHASSHGQVPSGTRNLNGSTRATDAVFGSPALLTSFQGNSRGLNSGQADHGFLQGQTREATDLLADVLGTDSLNSGL